METPRVKQIARMALCCTIAIAFTHTNAGACPLCTPTVTFTERLTKADAALLVRWVEAEKPKGGNLGSTVYEVLRVLKTPNGQVQPGERITLARFRDAKKGDLFLAFAKKDKTLEWDTNPLEVSDASLNYIVEAPSPDLATARRLEYFLKFLEHADLTIANDAYGEFANAPYEDIVPLAKILPRDRLRKWIVDPETSPTHLGLYGLMLGLCGNQDDVKLMESKITEKSDHLRLGIDGVISGYLLLTKEKGLELIDRTKLRDKQAPFGEILAAVQALRFMWEYAGGVIGKDRLKASMRILLDRPELADLVIADLSRWQDWSVQDRLMELYAHEEYNVFEVKRAIVHYLYYSTKDVPPGDNEELPEHAIKGKKLLEQLEEKDPKTVRDAKRVLLPRVSNRE